jgi:hypothetical protein
MAGKVLSKLPNIPLEYSIVYEIVYYFLRYWAYYG